MPAMFIQPDDLPDPHAEPGTRAFRLAALHGYCDEEQARAVLDAIEESKDRSRTVSGAADVVFVLAVACEALDRGTVSHHDLISAMERVGIDPTQTPRDSITIDASARLTEPDGEGGSSEGGST